MTMSQIKSRVKAPVTALVHLHRALSLWLQCMESGERWPGAGGRELASKKSIYQTNTSREQLENTRSGSPYLTQGPGIPSLNPATDMQLINIKEGWKDSLPLNNQCRFFPLSLVMLLMVVLPAARGLCPHLCHLLSNEILVQIIWNMEFSCIALLTELSLRITVWY